MAIKLRLLLPAALQIQPQTENTDEESFIIVAREMSLALKIVPWPPQIVLSIGIIIHNKSFFWCKF